MIRIQVYSRILLLAAFAGAMTELALSIPPRTTFDIVLPIVILVPLHIGLIFLTRWMWRQPPDRRYLDFSRGTCTFLLFFAYIAGAVLMLMSSGCGRANGAETVAPVTVFWSRRDPSANQTGRTADGDSGQTVEAARGSVRPCRPTFQVSTAGRPVPLELPTATTTPPR